MKLKYQSPVTAVEDMFLPQDIFMSSYSEGGGGSYTDDDLIDNGEY